MEQHAREFLKGVVVGAGVALALAGVVFAGVKAYDHFSKEHTEK